MCSSGPVFNKPMLLALRTLLRPLAWAIFIRISLHPDHLDIFHTLSEKRVFLDRR